MEEIDRWYKSGKPENLKLAFAGMEKLGWDLKRILEYTWENHAQITLHRYLENFPDEANCILGPLKFNFYTWEDDEPLDIDTHYVIHLTVILHDDKGDAIGRWHKKDIHTEFVSKLGFGLEPTDQYAEAHRSMREAFLDFIGEEKHPEIQGLYSCLSRWFTEKPGRILYSEFDLDNILRRVLLCKELVDPHPCSDQEIGEIEKHLERKLPSYFAKFLQTVGLKQQLIPELIPSVEGFYIRKGDHLVIALDEGIGHETLLSLSDNASHFLSYYWQRYHPQEKITHSIKPFEEWVLRKLEWLCRQHGVEVPL